MEINLGVEGLGTRLAISLVTAKSLNHLSSIEAFRHLEYQYPRALLLHRPIRCICKVSTHFINNSIFHSERLQGISGKLYGVLLLTNCWKMDAGKCGKPTCILLSVWATFDSFHTSVHVAMLPASPFCSKMVLGSR